VLSRQGDAFFDQGRFLQSAQAYAKSSRSFEFVALRFLDVDERDALRIYLSDRLDLLDKRVSFPGRCRAIADGSFRIKRSE